MGSVGGSHLVTMSTLSTVEILLSLALLQSVAGLDMYQDAVDKYARWMKKYGSQRAQRNTNIDLNNLIFVPHRPNSGHSAIKAADLSLTSLRDFEEELLTPETVRWRRTTVTSSPWP